MVQAIFALSLSPSRIGGISHLNRVGRRWTSPTPSGEWLSSTLCSTAVRSAILLKLRRLWFGRRRHGQSSSQARSPCRRPLGPGMRKVLRGRRDSACTEVAAVVSLADAVLAGHELRHPAFNCSSCSALGAWNLVFVPKDCRTPDSIAKAVVWYRLPPNPPMAVPTSWPA